MAEPLPLRRLAWAFLSAPAISALILGLAAAFSQASLGLDQMLLIGIPVAVVGLLVLGYPLTLLFGIPAYLLLRRRATLTLFNSTLTGALVAGAPFLVLLALGPARKIISGITPAADLQICALVFGAGAVGGFAFGLIALARTTAASPS